MGESLIEAILAGQLEQARLEYDAIERLLAAIHIGVYKGFKVNDSLPLMKEIVEKAEERRRNVRIALKRFGDFVIRGDVPDDLIKPSKAMSSLEENEDLRSLGQLHLVSGSTRSH